MRPALPLLALLAGCAPMELAWEDIPVVDWTGNQARDAEDIQEEVFWMSEIAGTDTVAITRIALVPRSWLPHRAHYNEVTGRILIGAYTRTWVPYDPDAVSIPESQVVRHELCHGLDATLGISAAHADELPDDLVPEHRRSEEAAGPKEVFAILCDTHPRPERLVAAVAQACGLDPWEPGAAQVYEWAFPELVPPAGPDLEVDIAWSDSPLAPDEHVVQVELAAGVLWYLIYAGEEVEGTQVDILAVDPATGQVIQRYYPSPGFMSYSSQIAVTEDMLVIFDHWDAAEVWLDGGWQPAGELPYWARESTALGTDLYYLTEEGVAVVDVLTGAQEEVDIPREARWTAELHTDGERLLLVSYPHAWELVGEAWVPTQGPQPFSWDVNHRWWLLRDGTTLIQYGMALLALGHPDGTLSLPVDPCAGESLWPILTDGETLVGFSDTDRIGLVTLR